MSDEQQQQQQQQHQQQHDVNLFVNDLMDQMTRKIENMSKSVLDRINVMGERIESLEQSIDGLLETQGMDRIDSSSPAGLVSSASE
jgi:Heat shock factor binding protein 1.